MTCLDHQEQISAFVDHELEESEIRALFLHVSSCNECWTYYRRLEALHKAIVSDTSANGTVQPDKSTHLRSSSRSQSYTIRASVLLSGIMAFIAGALLTLVLLSAPNGQQTGMADQWGAGPARPVMARSAARPQ